METRALDEKSKSSQRDKYWQSTKKHVGHEEEKRRRRDSAKRRATRGERRPRGDWDEDDATFEKIRRVRDQRPAGGWTPETGGFEDLPLAVVTAIHQGRVQLDSGEIARVAGHLLVDTAFELAVGDEVRVRATDGPARIETRVKRRTCLSRPDPGNPNRALVIAANVDIAVIVVAAKDPPLRPGLIDRLLLAIGHGGATPVLCVNKIDLLGGPAEAAELEAMLAPYADLGVDVFSCSAATGEAVDGLRQRLAGKACVFVGHSGVGKSSVLNAIDPDGSRSTGDVREHDGRGRHTTTSSSLRALGDGTRVIDTPGVRAFGLDRLEPAQVREGFPEFLSIAAACRFGDCGHVKEPDCAVRAAVEAGSASAERYASYLRILEAT